MGSEVVCETSVSGLPTIRKVDSGIDNVRGRDHLPRITP
jgi:hypothetical protein